MQRIRMGLLAFLLTFGVGAALFAADTKISDMTSVSSLAGTEYVPVVQSSTNKKATPADFKTYIETGGTVTSSDPVLDMAQTWNSGGTTFTGLKANFVCTACADASMLADLQVGGTSYFNVTRRGVMTLFGGSVGFTFNPYSASTPTISAQGHSLAFNSSGVRVGNGAFQVETSGGALIYLYGETTNAFSQRNATTTQTFRVYNTYTDSSNYERLSLIPGAASGWQQIVAQTAGTGADNIGIALTPAGTGAISAHVPDSATTGGNARGANAVDFQNATRSAAAQAATGSRSGILSGQYNTASGALSGVLAGYQNTASGQSATAVAGEYNTASGASAAVSGGYENTASGDYSWVPGGLRATTRGLTAAYAYSGGYRAAVGDAQVIGQPVRRTTSNATPVSLATDGTPAATTVMVLPASSTLACEALVVAQSASAANNAGYKILAVIQRDGSNNTSLVGSATTTTIGEDTAGMDATIIANDTLESAEIQVTGIAATTIQWAGELKCAQVL